MLALIDPLQEIEIDQLMDEAERKYIRQISFAEKLDCLKGLDNPIAFIDEVIDCKEKRLNGWIMDNRTELEKVKTRPEWEQKFLVSAMLMLAGQDYCFIMEQITELKQMKNLLSNKQSRTNFEDRGQLIQRVKRIPIESLVVLNKQRTTSGRISGSCPFHIDNRPSFVIFRKENRFKCFSCGKSGDSVAFRMELTGENFNEALSALGRMT